jgi:hypothetical protein
MNGELSPEEAEERKRRCYELDQQARAGMRAGREAMWYTARVLHEFDEEAAWQAIGYDKLGDWLADPEVGMTRSTYHRMIGAYRELAVVRKVDEQRLLVLDVSKVDIVLPALRAGRVGLEKALDDVEALGARDLREEYLSRPDTPPPLTPGSSGDAAQPAPDADLNGYAAAPNDGTDEPTWAATGKALPDHGSETESGPVYTVDQQTPTTNLVTGEVAEPHDPNEPFFAATESGSEQDDRAYVEPTGVIRLQKCIQNARETLRQPQRLAGNRQNVREALTRLIQVVEEELR